MLSEIFLSVAPPASGREAIVAGVQPALDQPEDDGVSPARRATPSASAARATAAATAGTMARLKTLGIT
jgi:hypothetical protein